MAAADDIDCPANTTECLLIAAHQILAEVKELKNEYNWDPLTFGATLIIGIVALFFASLTIAQGLLAAGPGRHKCSSYAIGPWARLTRRHFDWEELRFRTIAFTPIIRSNDSGLQHRPLKGRRRVHRNTAFKKFLENYLPSSWLGLLAGLGVSVDPFARLRGVDGKGLEEYFPATWLALLTCLGMDDPQNWDTKPTGADYIPADLAATPAHGCIMDLVALSVAAAYPLVADISFKKDSGLPSVRSEDLILDFRQHPLLGLVGTIQTHKTRQISKHFVSSEESVVHISNALVHSKGFLQPPVNLVRDSVNFIARCSSNTHDSPYLLAQMFEVQIQEYARNSSPSINDDSGCCDKSPFTGLPSCQVLELRRSLILKSEFSIRSMPLLPLLLADRPTSLPVVFSSSRSCIFEDLIGLLPQSRFWLLSQQGFRNLDLEHRNKDIETLQSLPFQWAHATFSGDIKVPRLALRADIFESCLSYLRCGTSSSYLHGRQKNNSRLRITQLPHDLSSGLKVTRENIWDEIGVIDDWLRKSGCESIAFFRKYHVAWTGKLISELRNWHPDASIRAHAYSRPNDIVFQRTEAELESGETQRSIASTFEYMQHFKHAYDSFCNTYSGAEYGLLDENIKALLIPLLGFGRVREVGAVLLKEIGRLEELWRFDWGKGRFEEPNTAAHPLDDLLIYRAILMGLLLSTAIDTSQVLDNDMCKTIVPIL